MLTTAVDGGPAVPSPVAAELDVLNEEFEDAELQYQSNWEPRLVAIARELSAVIQDFPRGRWNRIAFVLAQKSALPAIDETIVTPGTPEEMQRRVVARLARDRRAASS